MRIDKEDKEKTNFTPEWGIFTYTVMPFGLKNVPVVFLCIMVQAFQDFIHKFLQVYLDDWIVYGLVKYQCDNLRLIFERCRLLRISLNIKKCVFATPFRNFLGHVIYK